MIDSQCGVACLYVSTACLMAPGTTSIHRAWLQISDFENQFSTF